MKTTNIEKLKILMELKKILILEKTEIQLSVISGQSTFKRWLDKPKFKADLEDLDKKINKLLQDLEI